MLKLKHLSFFLIILWISCSPESDSKLPPPQQVVMVEKTTDLGVVEHGIDADTEKDGIFIEWFLLTDPDVESYNIYRRSKNQSLFSKIATINIKGIITPFDTTFSYVDDDNLRLDDEDYVYYYYVTATNKDGVEGPKPDSLTRTRYMLLSKPSTYDVQNTVTINEQPIFSCVFQGGIIPNYFIVRIEEDVTQNFVWARRFENSNLDVDPSIDLGSVLNPPAYQQGVYYRWRIDAVGPDSLYSGSESEWKSFQVQ